jgi:hypothetical protein
LTAIVFVSPPPKTRRLQPAGFFMSMAIVVEVEIAACCAGSNLRRWVFPGQQAEKNVGFFRVLLAQNSRWLIPYLNHGIVSRLAGLS